MIAPETLHEPAASLFDEQPAFTSPLVHLWHKADGDQSLLGARLPVSYRQDALYLAGFRRDTDRLQQLGLAGFVDWRAAGTPDAETMRVAWRPRLRSLASLLDSSRTAGLVAPRWWRCRVLLELIEAITALSDRRTELGCEVAAPELNPFSLFVDPDGHVEIAHVYFDQVPSLSAAMVRASERTFLNYAAPEQCVPGRRAGPASSIFTLGAVCFEVVTGRPLFSAIAANAPDLVVRRKVRNLHPMASDVSPELAAFDEPIAGLLSPLPENRPGDLGGLQRLLEQWAGAGDAATDGSFAEFCRDLQRPGTANPGQEVDQLTRVTDITELNAS